MPFIGGFGSRINIFELPGIRQATLAVTDSMLRGVANGTFQDRYYYTSNRHETPFVDRGMGALIGGSVGAIVGSFSPEISGDPHSTTVLGGMLLAAGGAMVLPLAIHWARMAVVRQGLMLNLFSNPHQRDRNDSYTGLLFADQLPKVARSLKNLSVSPNSTTSARARSILRERSFNKRPKLRIHRG
jgi:hypothetical protein